MQHKLELQSKTGRGGKVSAVVGAGDADEEKKKTEEERLIEEERKEKKKEYNLFWKIVEYIPADT